MSYANAFLLIMLQVFMNQGFIAPHRKPKSWHPFKVLKFMFRFVKKTAYCELFASIFFLCSCICII